MAKHSQALVRIRYLCDSGLRSEVVIPLLMEELKRLVRFGTWVFAWANARGQLINSTQSPLRAETLQYFAEHFLNLARDAGYSVHEAMSTFPAVSNPRRTGRINPRMDETESYAKVWGPEGAYFNLTLAVRGADEAPLGLVQLFRPRDDVEFEVADEALMADVLPYVRRLLAREVARAGDMPMMQDGLAGVAVFPQADGPQFISDRAFALSTMAFNDLLPITEAGLQLIDPAEGLRAMYRRVRDAAANDPPTEEDTSPAVHVLSNERGTFSFEWEPSLRKGALTWSVVIRHKIPARLGLMSIPAGASLSDRQLEVCRLLLDGQSLARIAERIGVKPATLKDHTREIYRKLAVSNRAALVRKLTDAPPR